MGQVGTAASAIAYLPQWLAEAADANALDALLVGWAKACGWRSAGFAWPAAEPQFTRTVRDAALVPDAGLPDGFADAAAAVRQGKASVVCPVPSTSGRVFAAVAPAGKPVGLLWADLPADVPLGDVETGVVAATAKLAERSPAVAAAIGPVVDPDRLLQRLADASVIAGRMAHDFDNILTGIIGFADLSLPLIQPGTQAAQFVGEIGKVGQRGIHFTMQLHQLSRSGQVKPNPGSVAAAAAKEEARLKPNTPAGVRVETDLPASLTQVAMESGPLQVVVGHLLENAVDACGQSGTVRVSARPVELTEPDARGYLGRVGVGAHLELTVADTGPGIKPDVRRRLFVEPFYTTKVRRRGLGLAVIYRVLCAHRGGVRLDPAPPPGTGTVARVVLPLAAARPPAVAAGSVPATTVGG